MAQKAPLGFIHYFMIVFFFMTLVIALTIDIEQILIADVATYDPSQAPWPPEPMVRLTHWWGNNYDPACVMRLPYYKFLVWIDVLYYVPFYAIAIYAILTRKEWIKTQIAVQQTALVTGTATIFFDNVSIMLSKPEKYTLTHILTNFGGYSSYLLVPLFLIAYISVTDKLFPSRQNNNNKHKTK